jgi:hypothetical protein
MNSPPKLSSAMTVFSKFILPGAFLGTWPIWFFGAVSDSGFTWFGAAMWTAACVWLVLWSRPIKFVTFGGDAFSISNYFSTRSVPASHLRRIEEDRHNRTPTITLYFEPPTDFGSRIRIVPPSGFFSRAAFDDVSLFLHSLLSANDNARNA